MFDVDMTRLRVVDAFLVKYSAGKQRELPIHSDQSQFSLTIAINPASEYDGGGTYFFDVDATAKCDVGGFVVFPGHMAHGGAAITRGVRYIIAAFLYLSDEDDE
jgi:predicted 2-oxoglutarate/Fe(II)-dependent dioxygenase YbiX